MTNKKYSKRELAENVRDTFSNEGLDVSVSVSDKRRVPLAPNVMVFQTFAYLAATKLTPSANRVLMLFLSYSQYEGGVSMDVKTIMEELSLKSKKTVVSALAQLEEYKVLLKVPYLKDKRRNEYYINPIAAWKGNGYSRKDFMRNTDPDQLSLFKVGVEDHLIREGKEIRSKKALLSKWDEIEKSAIESIKGEDFE